MNGDHKTKSPDGINPAQALINPIAPIDHERCRYPYCIVWTPIPIITWIMPILGHMGICTSIGVIRDFAGPYFVSEDMMAFGKPTKYWQLTPQKAHNGQAGWDAAVAGASDIYKKRMHFLCYDNCHSHVCMALNMMNYDDSKSWTMIKLSIYMLLRSRYVSFTGFLKTWLPLPILITVLTFSVVLGQYLLHLIFH